MASGSTDAVLKAITSLHQTWESSKSQDPLVARAMDRIEAFRQVVELVRKHVKDVKVCDAAAEPAKAVVKQVKDFISGQGTVKVKAKQIVTSPEHALSRPLQALDAVLDSLTDTIAHSIWAKEAVVEHMKRQAVLEASRLTADVLLRQPVQQCVQCGQDYTEADNTESACHFHRRHYLQIGGVYRYLCCGDEFQYDDEEGRVDAGVSECAVGLHRSHHHADYSYENYHAWAVERLSQPYKIWLRVEQDDYEDDMDKSVTIGQHRTGEVFIAFESGPFIRHYVEKTADQLLMLAHAGTTDIGTIVVNQFSLEDSAFALTPLDEPHVDQHGGYVAVARWIHGSLKNPLGIAIRVKSFSSSVPDVWLQGVHVAADGKISQGKTLHVQQSHRAVQFPTQTIKLPAPQRSGDHTLPPSLFAKPPALKQLPVKGDLQVKIHVTDGKQALVNTPGDRIKGNEVFLYPITIVNQHDKPMSITSMAIDAKVDGEDGDWTKARFFDLLNPEDSPVAVSTSDTPRHRRIGNRTVEVPALSYDATSVIDPRVKLPITIAPGAKRDLRLRCVFGLPPGVPSLKQRSWYAVRGPVHFRTVFTAEDKHKVTYNWQFANPPFKYREKEPGDDFFCFCDDVNWYRRFYAAVQRNEYNSVQGSHYVLIGQDVFEPRRLRTVAYQAEKHGANQVRLRSLSDRNNGVEVFAVVDRNIHAVIGLRIVLTSPTGSVIEHVPVDPILSKQTSTRRAHSRRGSRGSSSGRGSRGSRHGRRHRSGKQQRPHGTAAAASIDMAVRKGYVMLRQHTVLRTRWIRVYAVLTRASLVYFRNDSEASAPLGHLAVKTADGVGLFADPSDKSGIVGFRVIHADNHLILGAEDEAEAMAWARDIAAQIIPPFQYAANGPRS